jgi:hypothetical protein
MIEVSSEAFATGEEPLVSCSAEKSKHFSFSTIAPGPCGDYLSQVLVAGSVFAAELTLVEQLLCRLRLRHIISVWGPAGGGGLWRWRALPLRSPTRQWRPRINGTILLDSSCRVEIPEQGPLTRFEIVLQGPCIFEKGSVSIGGSAPPRTTTDIHNFTFSPATKPSESPL